MAKKRQQDFHKTKLKPGKMLPRGRNVTSTAFKSKKIIMPSQARKEKSELTIQECVKRASHSGPVASRENALNQLNNLMLKENASIYLPDIIDVVAKNILDIEESLRNASVRVLETVLEYTDARKISSFIPLLTNILSCTLTHVDIKIKRISLKLLNMLLKTHPHLLCTSITILKKLLKLLSGQAYNTKSRKAVQKSNLLVSCGDSLYSQDWRIQVLAQMNLFLKAVLENLRRDVDKIDDSVNEVHWDCDRPLFVEIFAGGGLEPMDIEKETTSYLKPKGNDLEDPVEVQIFLNDIMDILCQIFIEEITDGTSKSDDDLVLKDTITNLSVLFQVLSNLGEWVTLISYSDPELEKSFSKNLNDKIFRNIFKFPFITRGPVFESKLHAQHQHLPCVRLNLAVCYLYSTFILKPDSSMETIFQQVLSYLRAACQMSYDIKYQCLPMLLKIARIYLSLIKTTKVIPVDFVPGILSDMSRMLRIKDDRPHKHLLISFFVELSLQIGENSLNVTVCWYSQLVEVLQKMGDNDKIDRQLLKNIKRIAARKHPKFLNNVEKMSVRSFKALLTHKNDDVCETAVFLIYNMRQISDEFLVELSDLILTDTRFHEKKAFMLIRLLTHRFSEKSVSSGNRVTFVSFLLNLAFDAANLDDRWANHDIPKFVDIWAHFEGVVSLTIHPSLHSKRHSKLLEVCCKSLNRFQSYMVNEIAASIIKEIMLNKRDLPVHCVIAILRLNNPVMMDDEYHLCAMADLINTVLHFLSVMSSLDLEDEWYECNVNLLMDNLVINRKTVTDFIEQQEFDSQIPKSGIVIYYMLKVIKFLIARKLFRSEDGNKMISILETCKKNCKETDISQQPLYNKIFNYFYYGL